MNEKNLLLLDTHVWIWLMNGDEENLSVEVRTAIDHAAGHAGIRVSIISVWELGMLEVRGRIRLAQRCLDWVHKALSAPGVSLAPLTPEIAIDSSRLPGKFHGDPADRILVATSRMLGAMFVTHDSRIIAYGNEHYLSTMPA